MEHCIHSEFFNPQRGGGLVQGFRKSQLQVIQEMTSDWYWYCSSPIIGLWETVICRDPKELRSSHASRGILTGKSTSSKWGGPDSFAHELAKHGHASGPVLHMRNSFPEWAASSGSKVGCLLGAFRLIGSSSLGSGEEALSVGTGGVM